MVIETILWDDTSINKQRIKTSAENTLKYPQKQVFSHCLAEEFVKIYKKRNAK